jgi:ribosomal protein S4E
LTGREVTSIVQQRLIKVDGKVRTDNTYPTGFMGTAFTFEVTLNGLIP